MTAQSDMHARVLDDDLRHIVRQIGRIEAVIARQRTLVARLESWGQDSVRAKELLLAFEEIRAAHIATWSMLSRRRRHIADMRRQANRQ